MRLALAALVAAAAWLVVMGPPANAAVTCEHRSAAHIAEHGGIDVDSAWHLAHGDLPTCNDGSGPPDEGTTNNNRDDNNRSNSDDKSRYCGRHWYC